MRHFKTRELSTCDYFSVVEYDCHGEACAASEEEVAPDYEIAFPTSGCYVRRDSLGAAIIDPTCLAFFNKDQPFEVDHPSGHGDRSLLLCLSDDMAGDLMAHGDAGANGWLFTPNVTRLDGRKRLAVWKFFGRVMRGARWDQEDALEALYGLLELVRPGPDRAPLGGADGSRSSRRRRKVADAGVAYLNENFRDQVRLGDMARATGCSPYHLCRTFKSQTGRTINHYLTQLRLSEALEMLRDPARSITSIAYDLGFASHSHFTWRFHGQFGLTPSRARQVAGVA